MENRDGKRPCLSGGGEERTPSPNDRHTIPTNPAAPTLPLWLIKHIFFLFFKPSIAGAKEPQKERGGIDLPDFG
jgi:hypothetical protein